MFASLAQGRIAWHSPIPVNRPVRPCLRCGCGDQIQRHRCETEPV